MAGTKIKLGFCPIGKFVFSHEDALHYKALLEEKLKAWHIDYVSIDGVLPDGIVRDQSHVDPVVDHFKRAGIDALFMPHCNFGTEGAVGMIGAKLGVPVLLWGPRDDVNDPADPRGLESGRRCAPVHLNPLHVVQGYLRKVYQPLAGLIEQNAV